MRFGLFSIASFVLLLFLIIINTAPSIPPEKIDQTFETIDTNTFDKNFSTDANLSNFIKYTGKGIAQEFHGGYYLASWANTWFPSWLTQNTDLLVACAILVLVAPLLAVVLHFALLIILAVCLLVWDVIKERRKVKPDG